MKRLRKFISFLIASAAVVLCILLLLPLSYGGTAPADRFLRMNDGGNFGKSITDSAAIALTAKSGIFDIRKNGQSGVFIYRIQNNKDTIETYWHLGEGNNRTAVYILIKDGVRYQFSLNENEWKFVNSRVCLTDLNRLAKNLSQILTDRTANTNELKTDLNGIIGFDLSKYIYFDKLPTVIRTLINSFEDEYFSDAAGYSFARNNFTLEYNFSPKNSSQLADYFNAIAKPAYTKSMQSIISIAGIAGGVTDLFGFDLYDILFDCEMSVSIGAFSGKLTKLTYNNGDTSLSVTNKKYGDCQIDITSQQLSALIKEHVENPVH